MSFLCAAMTLTCRSQRSLPGLCLHCHLHSTPQSDQVLPALSPAVAPQFTQSNGLTVTSKALVNLVLPSPIRPLPTLHWYLDHASLVRHEACLTALHSLSPSPCSAFLVSSNHFLPPDTLHYLLFLQLILHRAGIWIIVWSLLCPQC